MHTVHVFRFFIAIVVGRQIDFEVRTKPYETLHVLVQLYVLANSEIKSPTLTFERSIQSQF